MIPTIGSNQVELFAVNIAEIKSESLLLFVQVKDKRRVAPQLPVSRDVPPPRNLA
jgi:hypothetical protein